MIAARTAVASAWGDRTVRQQFRASGSGLPASPFAFDGDAIGLMRGFGEGAILGQHAVVANLDYRFPILGVQRGIGTLPVFVRTVHGAVFADLGHAWTSVFRSSELRRALGAELSFDAVVGYSLPITLTAGAAWRDDPVAGRRGFAAFGRLGHAF